ncbi:MAG: recombinase family protein [Anaerolineales bacterium]|nr:recombinase family protein [Anaerolineales bacterium]
MGVIGYIRVSTDKQDAAKQRHLLLEYAQQHQLMIEEFIEVEISSRKSRKERRIDELLSRLDKNDLLLVAELSRLGRNMMEVLNIITELSERDVEIVFVRQPELSTTGPHGKLLLAIYSYFAETERDFISIRTKQGLAAAKANGVQLGRPRGSKNKERALDPCREQIKHYLQMGLNLASIQTIINNQLEQPITYTSYRYFVRHDQDLWPLWQDQKEKAST